MQSPHHDENEHALPIFEQEHDRYVWRVQLLNWNGQQRLQVWPWYRPKDGGDLRPCSAKFGTGGFAIPIERVSELVEALQGIRQN